MGQGGKGCPGHEPREGCRKPDGQSTGMRGQQRSQPTSRGCCLDGLSELQIKAVLSSLVKR